MWFTRRKHAVDFAGLDFTGVVDLGGWRSEGLVFADTSHHVIFLYYQRSLLDTLNFCC